MRIRSVTSVTSIASAAILTLGVALGACSDGGSTEPAPVARVIELSAANPQPATAGLTLTSAPTFVVRDQNGHAMSGVPVTVTVTGGGTIANVAVTSSGTAIPVGEWTLGRAAGANTLTIAAGSLTPATLTVSGVAGPAAGVTLATGQNQSALAGTALSVPILLNVVDQFGNRTAPTPASFTVSAGGGSVAAATAVPDAEGFIAVPAWTLGRSAVPQELTVTVAGHTSTIAASVQTAYTVDVRFYGTPMTSAQQALFTNAAARIRAAVVGQLTTVDMTGANVDHDCGTTGVGTLAGTTDGLIIYASVQAIDGPGNVLASGGPCYIRGETDVRTIVGVMKFDAADLASLGTGQVLQDVITHEMLHVVGVGTYWQFKSLLTGVNTPDVEYVGNGGVLGCRSVGGTTSCAASVPVESMYGEGTANSHWRESTFNSELMTGFAENGPMPLSRMTIRSLADVGYVINLAAADAYTIFTGSLHASTSGSPIPANWEAAPSFRPLTVRAARSAELARVAAARSLR